MSVVWSATSPVSGRFSAIEIHSDFARVSECFDQLRSHGQGYLEVGLSGSDFPRLTLGFRRDRAVIHVFEDGDGGALLVGDGTVPADVTTEVLIMDDLSGFTGDVVMSVDHAWDLMCTFVRDGTSVHLGERFEL